MVKRLAIIVWWLGALVGGVGLLGTLYKLDFFPVAVIYWVVTLFLWSIAFTLGGKFFSPPKPDN